MTKCNHTAPKAAGVPTTRDLATGPGLVFSPVSQAGAAFSKLKVLDLFSGIGGFSLGLERTGGFETVAFCEIEPFPRKVLAKHWPEVPCYEDVTKLTGDILKRDGISVDVITGGFPCQDLSLAGKRAGMGQGTRSGLWSEIVRLIGELQPRYVIVENVSALLSGPTERRGGWFGRVLGDLAECGYICEWSIIPAGGVAAPHERERVWFVAYPNRERLEGLQPSGVINPEAVEGRYEERLQVSQANNYGVGGTNGHGDANSIHRMDHGLPPGFDKGLIHEQYEKERSAKILPTMRRIIEKKEVYHWPVGGSWSVLEENVLRNFVPGKSASEGWGDPQANHDASGEEVQRGEVRTLQRHEEASYPPFGSQHSKQHIGESNDGMCALSQQDSFRGDRIKACGNAVIPQIPEMIGNAILAAEAEL